MREGEESSFGKGELMSTRRRIREWLAGWSVCLAFSGDLAGQESAAKWFDADPLAAVEIDDLGGLLERFVDTDLARHQAWDVFFDNLTHPEHGDLSPESREILGQLGARIAEELDPCNVVVVVESGAPLSWACVAHTGAVDADAVVKRMVADIERCIAVRESDAEKTGDENGSDSGDDATGSMPAGGSGSGGGDETAVDDPVQLREGVFAHSAFDGQVQWAVMGHALIVASKVDQVEKLVARIAGEGGTFTPLNESRRYQSMESLLGLEAVSSASIKVHLDPQLVWLVTNYFEEQQVRAWGLHEIVGLGVAVHLCDSRDRPGTNEIAFNAFARITEPRTGIAAAVEGLEMPEQLPPMMDEVEFFWYRNIDQPKFWKVYGRLYDVAYGEGSYRARLDRGTPDLEASRELRRKYHAASGNLIGGYWYEGELGTGIVSFQQVLDADALIANQLESTAMAGDVLPYKMAPETINGYPCVLLRMKTSNKMPYGTLYRDGWKLNAKEDLLQEMASRPMQTGAPARIESMIRQLDSYFPTESEPFFLVATFPGYWETRLEELVHSEFSDYLKKSLLQKFSPQDPGLIAEWRQQVANFVNLDFPEPESREQCRLHCQVILMRILLDSFGKLAIQCADEEAGFRAVGKTFGIDPPAADADGR